MANYKVEPKLLDDLIPFGTEVDLYQGDCYLSLVAFKFVDTAVMGMKIPFHTNFEEINLRFYVERKLTNEIRRGVVFVKEIVPRAAICLVANSMYGENYERWNTAHEVTEKGHTYFWSRGECENSILVEYKNSLGVPPMNRAKLLSSSIIGATLGAANTARMSTWSNIRNGNCPT